MKNTNEFYKKVYDTVKNSNDDINLYDIFMKMDLQEFAKYGKVFFDDIRRTNDDAEKRLKMPLLKDGVEALERIIFNQCALN